MNTRLYALFLRILDRLSKSTGQLRRDNRGAIALMFALLIVPLILSIGMATDLAFAWYSRQTLQQLSDEISTFATSTARDYLAANGVSQLAGATTAANTQAQALCTDFANKSSQLSSVQCSVTITLQGLTVSSASAVSATYNTFFMKIVGSTQVALSESANAQGSLPPYIDFYMLLDNSPSMGIGATVQDMTNLANATGGCEFACHDTGEPSSNTYQTAKNLGNVTLRIDQVRSASQSLLTYAGQQKYANRYRMAAYSFGVEAYPGIIGLTQISALNSNFTTVQNNLSSLDLMWLPYNDTNNNDDSDIDGNLTALAKLIPTPGDGSSNANAFRVIFLVTDGAGDIAPPNPNRSRYWYSDGIYPGSWSSPCVTTYNDYNGDHCMQPVTVSVCNAIKAKNIMIAALYTTYFKYSNSQEYPQYIQPIASAIPANLQACASPGLYFEVNPQTTGINQAMQALFQAAVNQATRLTQ